MSKSDGDKVVEEIVEHIIMEKKGILKGHHFLPKKKSATLKSTDNVSNFWFFSLMTLFIGGELWLIYKMLI